MVRICASILTSADVTTECVSGLLDDRRRGRQSVISELGEADQGGMCAARLFQRSVAKLPK